MIKINEDSLRETLINVLVKAEGSTFSGWRIPLFVNDDGTVSAGSWISQNSWQPDAIEVPHIKAESWNLSDVSNETTFDENWTRDDEVEHWASESADFQINNLKDRIRCDDTIFEIELI